MLTKGVFHRTKYKFGNNDVFAKNNAIDVGKEDRGLKRVEWLCAVSSEHRKRVKKASV